MAAKTLLKFTHGELVTRACEWLAGPMGMHAIVPELKTWQTKESPDVIAWKVQARRPSGGVSTVVECKTSRSDFLADRAKSFRLNPGLGMGVFRWMFTPPGLIKVTELPDGWGLAECHERGVRKVHPSSVFTVHNVGAETILLIATLRRVHFPDLKYPHAHFDVGEEPGEGETGGLET